MANKPIKNVLVLGNSGSGKSTLAKKLSLTYSLAHFDLDTIAWENTMPPSRKPAGESKAIIDAFVKQNTQWVIEGCYSDLLALVVGQASELVFLDLPVEACIENAKSRPWEPHKYQTKEAQDANLPMLIDWISQYPVRRDNLSRESHVQLYRNFLGSKRIITKNTTDY